MSRFEAWTVHASVLLVGTSGLIYAWMLYWLEASDPFSVLHHPLQPEVQHVHIWTAPLLVFAAGLIWREHIWKHWKQGRKAGRRSGIALLLTLAPMVLSGYLLQTSVSEGWRQAWLIIHLVTSGLWLLGYAIHFATRVQRRLRGQARKARETSAGLDPSEGVHQA
jgi:hypothetical protein